MFVDDVLAAAGHEVHVCRFREARTLLRWLGRDLSGRIVVDVAGGDGYWAGRARGRGARAVSVDLARYKLRRGSRLRRAPEFIEGDALRLPLREGSVDAVLSVCALEHFGDGPAALAEMARILKPGGLLALSADALSRARTWPRLHAAHARRFAVQRTYDHRELRVLLEDAGLDLLRHTYQFRTVAAERAFLALSAYGGRLGFNAAAPLAPLVALSDAAAPNTRGAIVLALARKEGRVGKWSPGHLGVPPQGMGVG